MIPMKPLRVWLFSGCVYLGSWACWLPFVLAHRPTPFVLLLLGLMMPSLLDIVFTYLTRTGKDAMSFGLPTRACRGLVLGGLP